MGRMATILKRVRPVPFGRRGLLGSVRSFGLCVRLCYLSVSSMQCGMMPCTRLAAIALENCNEHCQTTAGCPVKNDWQRGTATQSTRLPVPFANQMSCSRCRSNATSKWAKAGTVLLKECP
jgi:hypothetical protein